MKARVRIELPPGVAVTRDVRAKLVREVARQMHVDAHVGCDHDLAKSENVEVKKLRYRAPQEAVERSSKLYEQAMGKMLDEIAAVLSE